MMARATTIFEAMKRDGSPRRSMRSLLARQRQPRSRAVLAMGCLGTSCRQARQTGAGDVRHPALGGEASGHVRSPSMSCATRAPTRTEHAPARALWGPTPNGVSRRGSSRGAALRAATVNRMIFSKRGVRDQDRLPVRRLMGPADTELIKMHERQPPGGRSTDPSDYPSARRYGPRGALGGAAERAAIGVKQTPAGCSSAM